MRRRGGQLLTFIGIPVLLLLTALLIAGIGRLYPIRSNKVFAQKDWPVSSAGKTVEIIKKNNKYQLYKNGAPYQIKGGAGRESLLTLKEAGGNSIRTYTATGLDTLLDRCEQLGISVLVFFDLGKPQYYFDYRDTAAVRKQEERVTGVVQRYKDHPALLAWGLGNELINSGKDEILCLRALEQLTKRVKAIDPNHPVTSAFDIEGGLSGKVAKYCPSLDFLSFNAFSALRSTRSSSFMRLTHFKGPYLLSEWGADGYWEVGDTQWGAPIEPSSMQKRTAIKDTHSHFFSQQSDQCIGNYLFYWGQKQEMTSSWFSLFSANHEKTSSVDLMYELWSGRPPVNKAPVLDSLLIEGESQKGPRFFQIGIQVKASVKSFDPEGDSLRYHWEIFEEGGKLDPQRAGVELKPASVPGSRKQTLSNQLTLHLPSKKGPYRLFVFAYDGQGNFGTANVPFYMVDNRLVE
jgi:hypothetical protein